MTAKAQLDAISSDVIGTSCEVNMLRLDLFEIDVPGNKYFKMKYNIERMREEGLNHLVTFGGAFSNHIAAVAAAGNKFGIKTTGIIRGEKSSLSNATLSLARENGMDFCFIDRQTYRNWKKGEVNLDEYLGFTNYYLLPEGGSNVLAVKGCAEILDLTYNDYDYVACGVGTGATLAGLIASSNPDQTILGFSSMKGGEYISEEIETLLDAYNYENNYNRKHNNWRLIHDYHFGGFARASNELMHFFQDFHERTGIELDLIYTSKMMYGIRDMIEKGIIEKNSKVLVIHSGGQQGNESMLSRYNFDDSIS